MQLEEEEYLEIFWQILTVETIAAPDGRRRTHFDHCWWLLADNNWQEEHDNSNSAGRDMTNAISLKSSLLLLQLIGLDPTSYSVGAPAMYQPLMHSAVDEIFKATKVHKHS